MLPSPEWFPQASCQSPHAGDVLLPLLPPSLMHQALNWDIKFPNWLVRFLYEQWKSKNLGIHHSRNQRVHVAMTKGRRWRSRRSVLRPSNIHVAPLEKNHWKKKTLPKFFKVPSLKLTYPLKMDGWNTRFLLKWPSFRGELLVSGRVRHLNKHLQIHVEKHFLLSDLGEPKMTSWT